jgi:hypothetical protein
MFLTVLLGPWSCNGNRVDMRGDEASRIAAMKIRWFEIAYGRKFQNNRQN